jgi:DNA-binding response OmpR family regulator
MLTARGDLSDRVVGLEMGADDYMPKPFEPRELVARIQSVLRRTEDYPRRNKQRQLYRSAELEVDVAKGAATLDGEALELTVTEFDILSLLIRNPGQTLSRDQIVAQLRGHEWNSVDRSVDVLISRLRHKLKDDPKAPRYLKTMWGTGYRFIGEVSPED